MDGLSVDDGATLGEQREEQRAYRDQERLLWAAEAMANVAGGPTWVALDVDLAHGRVLLITRDIIAQSQYNKRYESITWERCSLRHWLNTKFLDSLPIQVKSRIIEVVTQNPNNARYGTSGGNPTSDRVFLLSIDEAQRYFNSDADRVATFNSSAGWWWLRSPGFYQNCATLVDDDGSVSEGGDNVGYVFGGVRPALFLNLDA